MNKFESITKPLMWSIALVLAASVAGCGGSSGSGGWTPAANAPGAGTGVGGSGRGPAPVVMGTAANFVILTTAGVTNVHTSAITGNVGSSPITAAAMNNVFCSEITGTIYGVDTAYVGSGSQTCFAGAPANKITVDNAVADMGTAYTDAQARPADYTELGAGNIGGLNLSPATYKWGTGVSIPTDVTLTGGPNDVWIFQIAQGLTVSSGVKIILAGGALPQNVYWATFAAADLGTTSQFKGVILSQTSITIKTGASIDGRMLAGTAVNLQQNRVTQP